MSDVDTTSTDRNGDPVVGNILDIIDQERTRYKVAVAVATYAKEQRDQALDDLLEAIKKQDPTGASASLNTLTATIHQLKSSKKGADDE